VIPTEVVTYVEGFGSVAVDAALRSLGTGLMVAVRLALSGGRLIRQELVNAVGVLSPGCEAIDRHDWVPVMSRSRLNIGEMIRQPRVSATTRTAVRPTATANVK
jgi:hypothetical protein